MSDAEWAAAHERLAAMRAVYLRRADGRLWGRPMHGKESPYLLTGFSACGVCGASLYVLSTPGAGRPAPRRFTYVCTVHKQRGTTVCANAVALPMVATDQAILDALERSVLDPRVVERAILLAIAELDRPAEPVRAATDLRADLADARWPVAPVDRGHQGGGGRRCPSSPRS